MIRPTIVRAVAGRKTFVNQICANKVNFVRVQTFFHLVLSYQNFFDFQNAVERANGAVDSSDSQIPNAKLHAARPFGHVFENWCAVKQFEVGDFFGDTSVELV